MTTRGDIVEKNAPVADIDAGIVNKWRWDWLKMEYDGIKYDCFEKLKIPGKAYCKICRAEISYKSGGGRALTDHIKGKRHAEITKTQNSNYRLSAGFGAPGPSKVFSIFTPKSKKEPSTSESTPTTQSTSAPSPVISRPLIPLADRQSHAEATVLAFVAEKSLPLSMAPSLIEFAKHMARDPVALDSLSMERTSASYKFTFGLAKTLQEDLVSEVASARFYSLNLDEAMSSNHQKVLAVLISFFSEALQKVVIQHLGSLSLTRVDSCSVVSALKDLLSKNGLKWERCLSILMDSCNVMRGKKNGVEARLRNTVAPHLLDIDGDSCHHIHGCCKKFTSAFGGIIERLFSDIFCDFKYSPVFQQSLQGICEILDTKYTMPQRFLSHRWLSVLDLTDDTLRLLDCYTQLYYEFLPKSDKTIYHSVLVDILQKQHVTMEGRQEIRRLRAEVGKTSLTSDGKERKARILKSLFYDRDNTLMQLKFFSSVLPLFKEFVLLFQRQDPQIHILHERQVALFREFLVFFLQPERMRSHGKPLSVKELLQLQIEDKSAHLPSDLIFVGKASAILHKKDTSDQASFRITCKKAFIAGAQALQEKLPLANGFLRAANGLNPALDSNSALRKMLTLPSFVPGVFCKDGLDETSTEDAEATYDKEVRKFVSECQSSPPADNQRIDEWWANIFNANPKAFPHLQQVVKAVLCCFHGPVVESTFNLMGDVLDERSGRMAMETVSAFQTVKYSIKASGKSSLQLFRRNDVKRDPVNATLHQNMEGAHSMYLKRLEQHREDRARKLAQFKSEQAKVASKRKAIEASRSSAKKARLSHLKKQAHR